MDDLARENLRLGRRVKRLESTLEQVEAIRDGNAQLFNRIMLEPRGEIALKGKGEVATWFVVGRRPGPPL